MKRFVDIVQYLVIAGTAVFLLALFVNEPATPDGTAASPVATDGAAVFAESCASCHGADGAGGFGPALAGGAVVAAVPDPAEQVAVITDGRGGMPSFEGQLSPEEIQAVTDYTRDDL